jgi:hypothetical protein
VRAVDVRADEVAGFENRAVDVRLGGEVDDRLAPRRGTLHRLGVGDVAHAQLALHAVEVLPPPRVGELVEHDDLVAPRD